MEASSEGFQGPEKGCCVIERMEFVLYEGQVVDLLTHNM